MPPKITIVHVEDMTDEYIHKFQAHVFGTFADLPPGMQDLQRKTILEFNGNDLAWKYEVLGSIKYSKDFMNNGLFVMQYRASSSAGKTPIQTIMMWRHKQKYWNHHNIDQK